MTKRILLITSIIALTALLGLFVAGMALAQEPTPEADSTPARPFLKGLGRGFGFGGSWTQFDAMAQALNLTPTQLFEELHSGKTLVEIAEAQGIDLQAVQDAANAARTEAMRERIAQAVEDGEITQAQADWLLQGLEQGFLSGGRGFGLRGGRHGFPGFGFEQQREPAEITTPIPGTSS